MGKPARDFNGQETSPGPKRTMQGSTHNQKKAGCACFGIPATRSGDPCLEEDGDPPKMQRASQECQVPRHPGWDTLIAGPQTHAPVVVPDHCQVYLEQPNPRSCEVAFPSQNSRGAARVSIMGAQKIAASTMRRCFLTTYKSWGRVPKSNARCGKSRPCPFKTISCSRFMEHAIKCIRLMPVQLVKNRTSKGSSCA